ncbi:LytTR family DNA-binding domain-containing protein [uncultured Tenacibaculum sp.]|uniref:LytTR family DNA-binding domain-containing protein n=1 Tax=uncultured Tenacibaculum sp. TaxID=174713 RepID=UPI002614EDBF|nr:LytTR family DNA-binding domain-containing protein [uncultured Tenacibaculum sp.]
MSSIFNQKYTAPIPESKSVAKAIFFGLFIGLFLIFFEPFDINLSTNENKNYQLLFFGCITTLVLLVFLYVFPLLFPKIFSDIHWKVKHQIILYLIALFVIATLNGFYTNYINHLSFNWSNYWWIINKTFVLGGIPIAFLTLLDYRQKVNLNIAVANNLSNAQKERVTKPSYETYNILTDLKSKTFCLKENDFNYAMAVGNYIDVFVSIDNTLKRVTYRVSLSSFETQLKEAQKLVRCHRSYFVNLKKVESISGNAQGLKLKLENQSEIVPVSRKYIPIVKHFFQENQ